MERRDINPWPWNESGGWSQAVELRRYDRMLLVSGQVPISPDGVTLHAGDTSAQVRSAMDNLESILRGAGFELANIVRLTIFTTRIDEVRASFGEISARLRAAGTRPACALIGVSRLAREDLIIEIEVTAVA